MILEWIKSMNHRFSRRRLWRTQGRGDGQNEGYCRWPRGFNISVRREGGGDGEREVPDGMYESKPKHLILNVV